MKISFIGAGNMAGAIIGAILNSGRTSANEIGVFDKMSEKCEKFAAKGVHCASTLKEAVELSPWVLIAVKPQDMESVLTSVKDECVDYAAKTYISIAAGISTGYIERILGKCAVVRVMPNTPLLVGCGATAISRNSSVPDKDFTKICGIFAAAGTVSVLPEEKMNAVISVNSSSPAYFFAFVKAMIDAGVKQGIDEKVASSLAIGAAMGAAKMLESSGMTPEELIRMVKSPKGTTEKALDVFEKEDLHGMVERAMEACTIRAEELGK